MGFAGNGYDLDSEILELMPPPAMNETMERIDGLREEGWGILVAEYGKKRAQLWAALAARMSEKRAGMDGFKCCSLHDVLEL